MNSKAISVGGERATYLTAGPNALGDSNLGWVERDQIAEFGARDELDVGLCHLGVVVGRDFELLRVLFWRAVRRGVYGAQRAHRDGGPR